MISKGRLNEDSYPPINIRPQQGNRGMEIENPKLREKVEIIIRNLLDKELP